MSILDALSSIGGGLGTLGAGVAGWVATRINEAREAAQIAVAARTAVEAALVKVRADLEALDTIKRGIKLEIEHAKSEVGRPSQPFLVEPGAQSNGELGRRLDDLSRRLEELKQDLVRERGARHAMQHQLTEDGRKEEQTWREMHRALGEILGQLRAKRE